jgi:Ca2+-binding EF-hand superfamily protein
MLPSSTALASAAEDEINHESDSPLLSEVFKFYDLDKSGDIDQDVDRPPLEPEAATCAL